MCPIVGGVLCFHHNTPILASSILFKCNSSCK
uniref:Uncharacterized protein n=1 Tax=Anguilla anguilla TaxID=7936 RepID=A0A0E9S6S3_ANGAN